MKFYEGTGSDGAHPLLFTVIIEIAHCMGMAHLLGMRIVSKGARQGAWKVVLGSRTIPPPALGGGGGGGGGATWCPAAHGVGSPSQHRGAPGGGCEALRGPSGTLWHRTSDSRAGAEGSVGPATP